MSGSGEIRDLCWRSEAQLASLARRLQAGLAEWAGAWGLTSVEVTCHNAWEAPAAAAASSWQAFAGDSNGAANVWWTGDSAAVGMALFGGLSRGSAAAPGAAAAPIAHDVADDAVAALRAAVVKAMGWLGATGETAPPESGAGPWSGAVLAECRLQGVQALALKFRLRQDAWPRVASQGRLAQQGGLSALSEPLADQPVAIQARMADVTLSLGELMGLQLGDVLVTPQRLDAPLAIEAAQGAAEAAPLFGGWLAQRSGHMAVALAPAGDRADRQ